MTAFQPASDELVNKIKELRGSGMTTPQVSRAMGISETTVRKYSREFPMRKSSRGQIFSEKHFTERQLEIAMSVVEKEENERRGKNDPR
ncbi:MAG: hypothetical protein ACRC5T_10780 [Cetobacterium sp.]